MFVDIACVFYGWRKEEALEIWKRCSKCSTCCGCGTPYTSLSHLIDKSLVELEKPLMPDVLTMHGLLRDLGQNIGMADGSHLLEGRAVKAIESIDGGPNKVRALNLANCGRSEFESEKFAKMINLRYLVLNGCEVSDDLGSISKELRWLQWRHMPLTSLPRVLDLSNLTSLDFSQCTEVASTWTELDLALEVREHRVGENRIMTYGQGSDHDKRVGNGITVSPRDKTSMDWQQCTLRPRSDRCHVDAASLMNQEEYRHSRVHRSPILLHQQVHDLATRSKNFLPLQFSSTTMARTSCSVLSLLHHWYRDRTTLPR